MNLTTIFMLTNTVFIILVMIKLSEDFGYIKSMLEELLDQKEKEPVELPPLDEPMRLSKEEAEVLQGLADMLTFNGELPKKE